MGTCKSCLWFGDGEFSCVARKDGKPHGTCPLYMRDNSVKWPETAELREGFMHYLLDSRGHDEFMPMLHFRPMDYETAARFIFNLRPDEKPRYSLIVGTVDPSLEDRVIECGYDDKLRNYVTIIENLV